MVEGSPWINTARRSSQKKRRSGVPPDILGLFHDIPTDGKALYPHGCRLNSCDMQNRMFKCEFFNLLIGKLDGLYYQ